VPPLAVGDPPIITLAPSQMVSSGPASKVGFGLTVTVMLSIAEQPAPSETVTVYVVVDPGLAVGLDALVLLNPVEGLHA
jgi:hypothetical protein